MNNFYWLPLQPISIVFRFFVLKIVCDSDRLLEEVARNLDRPVKEVACNSDTPHLI